MTAPDWRPDRFAAVLVLGPERPPVTEAALFPGGRPDGETFSELDHMVPWFLSQHTRGGGAYSRRTPNLSARTTYGRLLTGTGLLWIGESLGAPPGAVRAAAAAMAEARGPAARAGAVRGRLPWAMVAALAADRERERGADIEAAVPFIRRAYGI